MSGSRTIRWGNFWKLAYASCFHCGFEEIIPLNAPTFDPKDFLNVPAGFDTVLFNGDGQDVWRVELERQFQQYQKERALWFERLKNYPAAKVR